MTPAELTTMSGDELQTLLIHTDPIDDRERYEMISYVADRVWCEYQVELRAMEGKHDD